MNTFIGLVLHEYTHSKYLTLLFSPNFTILCGWKCKLFTDTLILFPGFEIIPRLLFQIIITRTLRGLKWVSPLRASYCEILVSSINRENFLLPVNSLIFCTDFIFSKRYLGTYSKVLALLVFSIYFMISNPSESYFIYIGFCHSILNSNIDLNLLFLKNIRKLLNLTGILQFILLLKKEMNFLQF